MRNWEKIELVEKLSKREEIKPISGKKYEAALINLANLMGCDNLTKNWWWENSQGKAFSFNYGNDPHFYENLLRAANGLDKSVYIFVTDSYAPPWPCFQASFIKISSEILNSSLTEFIILDSDFDWAMADTHHNQLLLYGHYQV